ncbi:MAG: glycine cleavage system protein R [Actinomycetota bacterium]
MSTLYAVTVIGGDRPGIVAGVAHALYDCGCNLEDVSSTILRGHFTMTLIVRGESSAAELEERLTEATGEMGLIVAVREVEEENVEVVPPTHMLSVYGADKPGIVLRVTDALARAGANITDLNSRVIGDADQPVYALMLEVAWPGAPDGLQETLVPLVDELGVELSVRPVDSDLL